MANPFRDGRRLVAEADYCEACGLAMFLCGVSKIDATLCCSCAERMQERGELEERPCPCCGRRHARQFHCGWCNRRICDGCIYGDHEWDADCIDPYVVDLKAEAEKAEAELTQ